MKFKTIIIYFFIMQFISVLNCKNIENQTNLLNCKLSENVILDASLNRFPSKSNYIFFKIDIDGDGKKDSISFQITGRNRERFLLKVNNTVLKKFIDGSDVELTVIDLNPSDKIKEIMIRKSTPLNYKNSFSYYFLKYYRGKLSYIGIFPNNDGILFKGKYLQVITDKNWWIKKEKYFLTSSHILRKSPDKFINVDKEVVLKKHLPVMKKKYKNSPVSFIPAGNKVNVLFYTVENGKEWFVIKYLNFIGYTTVKVLEKCRKRD